VASKPRALGFGGYRVFFYLRGSRSPVRFRAGEPLEFVFTLPQRVDPHSVQFFVLHPAGDRRELIQSEPGPLASGPNTSVLYKSGVPYEIQKYGESAYRLIPSKELPPGEYTFSLPNIQVGYSFGIDSAGSPTRKK